MTWVLDFIAARKMRPLFSHMQFVINACNFTTFFRVSRVSLECIKCKIIEIWIKQCVWNFAPVLNRGTPRDSTRRWSFDVSLVHDQFGQVFCDCPLIWQKWKYSVVCIMQFNYVYLWLFIESSYIMTYSSKYLFWPETFLCLGVKGIIDETYFRI